MNLLLTVVPKSKKDIQLCELLWSCMRTLFDFLCKYCSITLCPTSSSWSKNKSLLNVSRVIFQTFWCHSDRYRSRDENRILFCYVYIRKLPFLVYFLLLEFWRDWTCLFVHFLLTLTTLYILIFYKNTVSK